ncbi:MAG: ATP-dependent RNA helicase DeaD [Paracoccaceae bacterium]|jgi:ATP-dependent RNA helicase DeaD
MIEFPGVVPALAEALNTRGYTELTPVQRAVLNPEIDERDMLVSAQTGSGKTVAFGIAIARTLLGDAAKFGRAEAPLALAVAPTRELALQVCRELEWLYGPSGAVITSCVGGMDPRAERRALDKGAHFVVGTPGRLRDHIERGALDMTKLQAVVLDEADEMLDLGFREDLEFILGAAPEERRTLMFSATVPRAIATLAQKFQKNAFRVVTEAEREQHVDIDYRAYTVAPTDRETAIYNLLRYHDAASALVFCSTRAAVSHMTARFANRGFSVVALSGELSQSERSHALQAMRDGRARVCVATDVAARGIDLPTLELVIHADLPNNRDTLLHRSGRTGRAGRKGTSALIVPHRARRRAESMLRDAGVTATWANPPSPTEILARDDERILADPGLTEAVAPEEQAIVDALLKAHGPERIAAAFLRRLRSGMAAPEELIEVTSGTETVRPPRESFGPSGWIKLSVGRKHRAEPRWLLPLICNAGGLSRTDVGAIRMEQSITHVEIAAGKIEAFLTALGPDMALDQGIEVARSDGPPDGDATRRPSGPRDGDGAKPRRPRPAGPRDAGPGGPKWSKDRPR